MAIATKRRLTDEFKREAVALWETNGRMQTEVAAELGIDLAPVSPDGFKRLLNPVRDARAANAF